MEKADLITKVKADLKTLVNSLRDPDDFDSAVDDALAETGFMLPTEDAEQILWLKRRTLRHCFFILTTSVADKFGIGEVRLNQKFDHLKSMVTDMDAQFEKAKEAGLCAASGDFGMETIDAGFSYDPFGNDITYK